MESDKSIYPAYTLYNPMTDKIIFVIIAAAIAIALIGSSFQSYQMNAHAQNSGLTVSPNSPLRQLKPEDVSPPGFTNLSPIQKFTLYSIPGPVTAIPGRSGGAASANCGSDGFVTGGGYITSTGIAIVLTMPSNDFNSWKVEGYNRIDEPQPLRAIAMCIKPAL